MLRIVLPKGSLERATLDLFEAADLAVVRSSTVEYRAAIDDPRVAEVRILRPQEIPVYVAEGLFDLGITGRDWVEETASDVVSLGELRYSKATTNPVKVVVAVADDSPARQVGDLPQGVRVSSEYPELARRFFAERGIDADVRLSYGASEAKVPDIAPTVDILLCNLEDGVPASDKEAARAGLVEVGKAWSTPDTQLWTRVNSLDSPWCHDDLVTAVTEVGEQLEDAPSDRVPQDVERVHAAIMERGTYISQG